MLMAATLFAFTMCRNYSVMGVGGLIYRSSFYVGDVDVVAPPVDAHVHHVHALAHETNRTPANQTEATLETSANNESGVASLFDAEWVHIVTTRYVFMCMILSLFFFSHKPRR